MTAGQVSLITILDLLGTQQTLTSKPTDWSKGVDTSGLGFSEVSLTFKKEKHGSFFGSHKNVWITKVSFMFSQTH